MPQSEDDKIMLDSSSFKALASETRVLILKELDKKRCTASEIAKSLGISVQAASEHLENLRVAGLVAQADEGRKWFYFDLTEKGKAVLHPDKSKRLWVLFSLFVLILAGAGFMLFNQPQQLLASPSTQPFFAQDQLRAQGGAEEFTQTSKTMQQADSVVSTQAQLPAPQANSTVSNSTGG